MSTSSACRRKTLWPASRRAASRSSRRVNFTASTVDDKTGMVQMRAAFPNPKATLLPGQFVRHHLGHLGCLLTDGRIDADEVAALLVDNGIDGDS